MRIAHILLVLAAIVPVTGCVITTTSAPPPSAPPPPHGHHHRTPPPPPPAAPTPPPTQTVQLPTTPSNPAPAPNDQGWTDLGSVAVTTQAQASAIAVGTTTAYPIYRFGVASSQIELSNIVFVYDNGQRYSPNTRHFIRNGGRSQNLDLPGGAHVVRTVEFRYQSIDPAVGRATVHLYGHP
jgi:hypothetical protein